MGVAKGLLYIAEELAKNSGKTQVATTGGSYKKAGDILVREDVTGALIRRRGN